MSDPYSATAEAVDQVVDVVAATAPDVREGLVGRRVYQADENPSGERQLEADVYADELLEERLLALECVGSYASEERDEVVEADAGDGDGDGDRDGDRDRDGDGDRDGDLDDAAHGGDGEDVYHVAADPLDGSSNLKSNNTMGTLFGVYEEPLPTTGRKLVAAGFVLFGPITTMVVARDGRVTESVLDDDGSREVVTEDLRLPEDPTVYGFGGRVPQWTDAFADYASEVEQELKLRYGGAMIGDVNQVLTYGGIFGYPGLVDRPEGKLRLLFEGHPIAYVVETAGGASSDGDRSLLDCEPDHLHQRTPLFVGDETYIERLESSLDR